MISLTKLLEQFNVDISEEDKIKYLQEGYYNIIKKLKLEQSIHPVRLNRAGKLDGFNYKGQIVSTGSEIAFKQLKSILNCDIVQEHKEGYDTNPVEIGDPLQNNFGYENFEQVNEEQKSKVELAVEGTDLISTKFDDSFFMMTSYTYPYPVMAISNPNIFFFSGRETFTANPNLLSLIDFGQEYEVGYIGGKSSTELFFNDHEDLYVQSKDTPLSGRLNEFIDIASVQDDTTETYSPASFYDLILDKQIVAISNIDYIPLLYNKTYDRETIITNFNIILEEGIVIYKSNSGIVVCIYNQLSSYLSNYPPISVSISEFESILLGIDNKLYEDLTEIRSTGKVYEDYTMPAIEPYVPYQLDLYSIFNNTITEPPEWLGSRSEILDRILDKSSVCTLINNTFDLDDGTLFLGSISNYKDVSAACDTDEYHGKNTLKCCGSVFSILDLVSSGFSKIEKLTGMFSINVNYLTFVDAIGIKKRLVSFLSSSTTLNAINTYSQSMYSCILTKTHSYVDSSGGSYGAKQTELLQLVNLSTDSVSLLADGVYCSDDMVDIMLAWFTANISGDEISRFIDTHGMIISSINFLNYFLDIALDGNPYINLDRGLDRGYVISDDSIIDKLNFEHDTSYVESTKCDIIDRMFDKGIVEIGNAIDNYIFPEQRLEYKDVARVSNISKVGLTAQEAYYAAKTLLEDGEGGGPA